MGKSRRKHSREFKIEAVKQVVDSGRPVTVVARGLGVNPSLLSRWKTEFETSSANAFPGNGRLNPAEEEIRRLRRELATALQERDILKKAALFFAKAKN